MSQPPWNPGAGGGDTQDDTPYRGAHSSADDTSTPAADDLWGGPGTPGPWSGGADQPWASSSSTDPWAGAKNAWSTDRTDVDDSGPAFPVPGAAPGPAAGPDGDSPAPAPIQRMPEPQPAPAPATNSLADQPTM